LLFLLNRLYALWSQADLWFLAFTEPDHALAVLVLAFEKIFGGRLRRLLGIQRTFDPIDLGAQDLYALTQICNRLVGQVVTYGDNGLWFWFIPIHRYPPYTDAT
jgi:hypothetical protein